MFVYNYCPLTFMTTSGSNITPDRLAPEERELLDQACGKALVGMISALEPSVVVAVGNFSRGKCEKAVEELGTSVGTLQVVTVNHPSPASPSGSRWIEATCLNDLVLASSKAKEIDAFLNNER
ncbi:unnamed protein product [Choristocarpus tenellus]